MGEPFAASRHVRFGRGRRTVPGAPPKGPCRMTFRDDGHRAVDWAADYLERVAELPVLAQVKPGEIRARLPQSPPEEPESFEAVLRDLDEILLPGVTHWQHPRFFAYFAATGSEPGILAELLAATLNSVGFLWRTAPASTELELHGLRLGGAAARVAGRLARPHRGHRVDVDARRADRRAAHDGAQRRRLLRARPLRRRQGRSDARHGAAQDPRRRRVPDARRPARARRRRRGRRHRRHDLHDVGRPRRGDRRPLRGRRRVAPRRRCLRRLGDGLPRAPLGVRGRRPRRFARRSTHTNGCTTPMDCSLLWTSRPDEFRDAFSLVPEFLRTTDEDVLNLSEYGPALGRRFRSLKLWAVLRCYGAEGLRSAHPRGDPPRRAVRGLGARRAGLGAVRAAAVLHRLLPARRARTRRTRRSSSA